VTRHDASSVVVLVEVSGSLIVVIAVVSSRCDGWGAGGGLSRACRGASSSPGRVSGGLLSTAWPGVLLAPASPVRPVPACRRWCPVTAD